MCKALRYPTGLRDAEKPRQENDYSLMDQGVSMQHKREINRHLHKFRWMSDVGDELGTRNDAALAVSDTEWQEAGPARVRGRSNLPHER